MSKINKIKTMLQSVLAQFAKMTTDKGLLVWNEDDDLAVGMSVFVLDEEGNESPAADGEYAAEDGTVYVIVEGKVAEIREAENEEETVGDDVQPEPETREEENAEDNAEEEPQENAETAEEEPQAEPEPEVDERDERIANLEAEVARLERENGELRERIAELEAKLEDLAAPPAEQEFENTKKVTKTGNAKLDSLSRILNA